MKKSLYNVIYWSARVLAFLLIVFLFMFSLDVFEVEATFWNQMLGLLMHNIPVIILILAIVIGWKIEIIPAIVFMTGAIVLFIMTAFNDNLGSVLVSFPLVIPAVLVSILFYLSWHYKKKVIIE